MKSYIVYTRGRGNFEVVAHTTRHAVAIVAAPPNESVTNCNQLNAARMREALVKIRDAINKWYDDEYISHGVFSVLWDLCSAALSKPARNCDLYQDADTAFIKFCGYDYAAKDISDSAFVDWLFAPAAELKGEGDGV